MPYHTGRVGLLANFVYTKTAYVFLLSCYFPDTFLLEFKALLFSYHCLEVFYIFTEFSFKFMMYSNVKLSRKAFMVFLYNLSFSITFKTLTPFRFSSWHISPFDTKINAYEARIIFIFT